MSGYNIPLKFLTYLTIEPFEKLQIERKLCNFNLKILCSPLGEKSALNPEGALLRLHFLIKFSNVALAKIASVLSEI